MGKNATLPLEYSIDKFFLTIGSALDKFIVIFPQTGKMTPPPLFEYAFRLILAKVSLIKLCQSLRTIDGHNPWYIDMLLSIVSSMLSMDMSWLLA